MSLQRGMNPVKAAAQDTEQEAAKYGADPVFLFVSLHRSFSSLGPEQVTE